MIPRVINTSANVNPTYTLRFEDVKFCLSIQAPYFQNSATYRWQCICLKYNTIIRMEQEFIEKELFLRNIGNNIRVARKAKNLSQEELAFKINSARNFIGCIERGEKAPTVYVLYKIATVLNVPIDNLLVI